MNRFELDKNHTNLGFTAKHMVFTTVRGQFIDYGGYVEVDPDDYTTATGEFTLQVASIDSNNEKRDEHLRSGDFFNAAQYPTLLFRPTAIVAEGGDRYAVTGDLT
nr:YceI family protein [Candidatus Dormibacteraeota bacterium]